jgi:hypothetical protein
MKQHPYLTKKNIALALLGLVTVMLTILSYMPKNSQSNDSGSAPLITSPQPADSMEFLPDPTPTPLNNIQRSQLESEGVVVENLYKNNPDPEFQADTTIAESEDYSIVFFVENTLFRVTLYDEPFDQVQQLAEERFLSELKITQQQACRLNVEIVKQPADFSQPSIEHTFSFCQ